METERAAMIPWMNLRWVLVNPGEGPMALSGLLGRRGHR